MESFTRIASDTCKQRIVSTVIVNLEAMTDGEVSDSQIGQHQDIL